MILTIDLAKEIEQGEINMLYARLSTVQEREGNPMGIHIQSFGDAIAFASKGIPSPAFNSVKGLTYTNKDVIDNILSFYKEHEIQCQFEVTPAQATPELFTYLQEKGFYQSSFHTSLYMEASMNQLPMNKEVTIRNLEREEFDMFASIYVSAFGMPTFTIDGVRQNNEILHGTDGWEFYVACIENQPVSIGVMHVKDTIATLAASATLPQFQRKGCHQLLLKKRIYDACIAGSKLIVAQASFGSKSQQNMQRVGMQIAYTKAIWTKSC
jgi:hypothetical protein